MPKKKSTKKKLKEKQKVVVKQNKLNLSDSFISLFLGVIIVVIFLILFILTVKTLVSRSQNTTMSISSTKTTDKVTPSPQKAPGKSSAITDRTYVVKEGDHLWDISVRAYGDGFRWVDIVSANNLSNPNTLVTGMVLKIPR